jgi:hypothetical protein
MAFICERYRCSEASDAGSNDDDFERHCEKCPKIREAVDRDQEM